MTRDELQRLIGVRVEMAAAEPPDGALCLPRRLGDCCPDRLRGVLDAGATRRCPRQQAPSGVAAMIVTRNRPDATRQNIEELCREAAQFHFATGASTPSGALCAAGNSGVGVALGGRLRQVRPCPT